MVLLISCMFIPNLHADETLQDPEDTVSSTGEFNLEDGNETDAGNFGVYDPVDGDSAGNNTSDSSSNPFVLQKGDIILGEYTWDAQGSRMYYWEHCQLYSGNNNVIHSIASPRDISIVWQGWESQFPFITLDTPDDKGVKEVGVSSWIYASHVNNYAILRSNEDQDQDQVISFCRDKIGQPYDYDSLLTAWTNPQLTHKQLDAQETEHGYGYYCTELVWAAYNMKCGIDLDPDSSWVSTMDIYENEYLDVVYLENSESVENFYSNDGIEIIPI